MAIIEKEKALDVVRQMVADGQVSQEVAEKYFPELKESNGERIRKCIEDLIKENTFSNIYGVTKDDCLAWLEKQCEQKSADRVEPKFKVGDKIISSISNIPYYVTEVRNGYYLTDVGCIIMFDAQDNFELSNQNPAWSEEDKKIWEEISDMLWEGYKQSDSKFTWDDIRDWVKSKIESFKDSSQPKQEWSEEDNIMAHDIDYALRCQMIYPKSKLSCMSSWIGSLKDRVQSQNTITDEELAQAKKDAYNDALDKIEYHSEKPTFDDGWSAAIWYLKKRNAQPQSQWKPSDLQLECLSDAIKHYNSQGYDAPILKGLLNELRKLKE